MRSLLRKRPQSAAPEPPKELPSLRARWLAPAEGGGTRRDQALARLREAGPEAPYPPVTDLRGINLIGEDLRGLNLAGCGLMGADLSDADLTGANLSRADLRHASLYRAKLEGCEFLGASLRGANLSECRAERASFGHADLTGANLFHACLRKATFGSACLVDADLRAADLEGARIREADLTGAHLTRARLKGADLGKSRVAGADFQNADLREARLRGLGGFKKASWIGTNIQHVDFTGAYLLRRHILDENYLFEFRTQSRYTRFLYFLWWITSNCGRNLTPWFLWNAALGIAFGLVYSVVDVDFGPYRTALSPFYYSFVTLTTLGYGDVVPVSGAAQVAATVEVLLGYLGLGGLLSILANKMARRAD